MSTVFSNEEDFESLLDNYYDFDEPERGDIRDAEILLIGSREIVVDLGVKRDGIVPPQDLERLPEAFAEGLQVGDVYPVYVMNPMDEEGNLIVSLNLGLQEQDWERADELLESGDIVECKAIGYNKGGLLVKFGRLEGFVPNTHLMEVPSGLEREERADQMDDLEGDTLKLKVIEVNQPRRRLILSQREAQREWRANQKERLLEELEIGDVVEGRVTGIRDFGAFVDVGGADGLIHVSELAWHRVPHPKDLLSVGDEVKVSVLELDHERNRIALSRRLTLPDPWDIVMETYSLGDVVEGEVTNVVDFGAFVVLDDGIEGLLHVSEMGDGNLDEPFSYVKRGDRLKMEVVSIEPDRKRIGFSQKNLEISQPTEDDEVEAEAS